MCDILVAHASFFMLGAYAAARPHGVRAGDRLSSTPGAVVVPAETTGTAIGVEEPEVADAHA